jgi:hypothetical protein
MADAGRSRFASLVSKATGSPSRDRDEQMFLAAKRILPELPGERHRNPLWNEQRARFGRNRAASMNSVAPSINGDSEQDGSRDASPLRAPGALRSSTLPASAPATRTTFTARPTRPPRSHNRTESEPFNNNESSSPLERSMTLGVPKVTR